MFGTLSIALSALLILIPFSTTQAEQTSEQKAVLVTGASSGLGLNMTKMMAGQGYFVYAGARKDKDIDALNALENVQAVRLDVTKQDQIDAAVKSISEAGRGLYGLVNNAGVLVLNPLIEIDEQEFDFQMNVNVYGPYRVTKAFAPLIIESKGRIATIGSIAGTLSSATWGPYSISKHAMEAFEDALRDEMREFGVKTSLIEPGTYKSKIADNAATKAKQRNRTDVNAQVDWLSKALEESGDPDDVSKAVIHALFDETPKGRYMVVPNHGQAYMTIDRAMHRLVEQNTDQKFSFSRDELIEILDKALAQKQDLVIIQ
jgi:NAD(P)-dependent dehydrogenase (short-subunit alcohol dehydrogenase family)